jgi:multidrug resistance protein, MATE family
LNIGISAWFQGRGDTVTPMRATLIGNGLNLIFDPLLIFGLWGFPELGVAGAALATITAGLFQVAYLAWRAAPDLLKVSPRPDKALVRSVLDMGIPIGVRYTLDMGSFVIFSAMITYVGPIQLAAHIIVVRICSMSFLPGHAVGEAAGVLVGQFVGAQRHHLAKPVLLSAVKLAVGIMASWGVIFLTLPEFLVAPFNTEAAVAQIAASVLMVAAAFQIFDAIVMAIGGGLNGAGDTRWVMIASLIGAWMIKVPGAYVGIFIFDLGAMGAWLAFTVELIVLSVAYVIRARGQNWLKGAASAATG